jgi:hypothetical protein
MYDVRLSKIICFLFISPGFFIGVKILVFFCHVLKWHGVILCNANATTFIFHSFMQVSDVKKLIEGSQGQNPYPADQQVLIHQGAALKDETTLEENKVLENNSFMLVLKLVGNPA